MVVTQVNDTLVITVGGVKGYIKIVANHTVEFENIPPLKIHVTSFGVNGKGIGLMNAPIDIILA